MAGKSIKKNYIYNVAYQLLIIITPLITTPYVSRKMGADGIGIYSFTSSVVTYFTMVAALGTARYGQREISYSQDDKERRSSYFWKIEALSCVSTFICMIAYIVYVFFAGENIEIYAVQIFSVIAVAADITWFFQGMEEFGRIVRRNVIFKFINILFIFLAVKSKDDLILYVCGLSLITLVSNLSLWPFLKDSINKPRKSDLNFLSILPEVIMLFIPSVAISIYTVLDKTMIGVITNSDFENGYYEQSLKVSRLVLTLVTSLGVVMVPRVGHHFFEGKMDIVKQYMYKSYRFVWMAGIPLCFGLCAIAPNFIPWFLGDGFDKVIPLLRVSSFLILAIGINNVTGVQYLIPTKRHNLFTLTVVLGAAVNFVLNLFLIKNFQSIGAAVASVVAESAIAITQLVIVRKEISGKDILQCSCKYFVAGIVMCVVVTLLGNVMVSSVIHSVILILTGIVIYALLLFLLRDAFFMDQIKSAFYMAKKLIHRA